MKYPDCLKYQTRNNKTKTLKHDWMLVSNYQMCMNCGLCIKPTKKFLAELKRWEKISSKFKR